jgi:hypothetical protein
MATRVICQVHDKDMTLDEGTLEWRCPEAGCKTRMHDIHVENLSRQRPGIPVRVTAE